MNGKNLILGVAAAIVVVAAIIVAQTMVSENAGSPATVIESALLPVAMVQAGPVLLTAEVASTPEDRAKGLGGRSGLATGEGMLLDFDKPDLYGIWMKNMQFPLDIIWLDTNLMVVHIESSVSPTTYPAVFKPSSPAKYVLEAPVGFVAESGLTVGATGGISGI